MLKRKLLKRALPLLLSVSMVFGSMPTTALAAEYEESAAVEETVLEESEPAGENDAESSDNTPESTGGEISEVTEESTANETSETGTTQEAETQNVDAEDGSKTEIVAETQNAAETETVTEVAEAAEQNAAALLTVIDTKQVQSSLGKYSELTYDDDAVTATYKEVTDSNAGNVFDKFVNDEIKGGNAVQVKVDNNNNANLKSSLTYKWTKVNADGNEVDMGAGETPKDAGSYRLKISLAKVENVCTDASASIDFVIKQAELTFDNLPTSVEKNETLAAFIEDVKNDYVLKLKDKDGNKVSKEIFVKSVNVTVSDAVTGEAIPAENAVFEQNRDYAYTISVELNDSYASNYKFAEAETQKRNLALTGDIKTKMEVAFTKLPEYTYTGSPITLPKEEDYTVKVTVLDENGNPAKDEDGNEKTVEKPVIKAEWAYADWKEENPDEYKFAEGEAPVEAGSYKLVLTFADETGRYAKCVQAFDVTVNPVSVYVKPSLANASVSSGLSEEALLKQVDYEVLRTADNQAPAGFNKETFWGVSYYNADKSQPYELVFELQRAELQTETDKDGNVKPVKDEAGKVQYDPWENNNGKALVPGTDVVDGSAKVKYRVVFGGKKAVYKADGSEEKTDVNDHGTNGADTNHKVDLTPETIDKNAIELTVTVSTVTIDTSAYNSDQKTKIYDGKPFYENRKDYKKATATGSGTLKYQWFAANKNVKTDKDGNETVTYTVDKSKGELFAWNDTDLNGNKYKGVSPYEVGDYMLVISYEDSAGESVSAEVGPYIIEKQKVQAEISLKEGKTLAGYTGVAINDFISDKSMDIADVVKPIVDNKLDSITLGDALPWTLLDYSIECLVEYKDNLNGEWKEASGFFEENREYRLRAKVIIEDSSLEKYYQSWEMKQDKEGNKEQYYYMSNALEIPVTKMGTAAVQIDVDESKIENKVKPYDGTPFAIPTEAVTVTDVKTGEDITAKVELTYTWKQNGSALKYQEDAKNAGVYDLYVSFAGNETYKAANEKLVASNYEITKRSVKVKPIVKESVAAGTAAKYENVVIDYEILEGSDILEAEIPYFNGFYDEATGLSYIAFNTTTGVICEADGKTRVANGVLKGNKTYCAITTDVTYDYGTTDKDEIEVEEAIRELVEALTGFTLANYDIQYEKTEFVPVRGNSVVTGYGTSIKDAITNSESGMTHTIVPKDGVEFYYNNEENPVEDKEGNPVVGNLLIFDVNAPLEYFKNGSRKSGLVSSAFDGFVYKNSLETAGGYSVSEDKTEGTFRVAIPITKEDVEGSKTKSFQVRWEDGYVETITVNCAGVVLEDDLQKAVAPKSLAFNSPVTKMVVGEKQQLDVKVTKANIDDITCLKYQLKEGESQDILSVSETGAVVALSKGNATVEAIPCYKDEKGELVPIEGAKPATVKIAVNDVTAPKIKTITAYDIDAWITYPSVSDGYRREIYVLEGKNLKNDVFDEKIKQIKHGDWKAAGFATAPVYNTKASADKGNMTELWVRELEPNTEYTVYVRNVSGIRTLADGTTVTASAAGSTKGFKTTLPQVWDLDIEIDDAENKYFNKETGWYMVPLKDKNVATVTTGWYQEIYADETVNRPDEKEYKLPLDKETAKTYAQPKLNYYVSKVLDLPDDDNDTDTARLEGISFDDIWEYGSWSAATDIAKIDKNGKLTLTGVGVVYVLVADAVTGCYDIVPFIITATADRMDIAKSVKLKVGQKADLFDLMTYYEGTTKLTGYVNYKSQLADLGIGTGVKIQYGTVGDTDGFIIVSKNAGFANNILMRDYAGEVTAVKPNKTMTVAVKDAELTQEAVGVEFTSSAIDPVKSLKTTMVTDKYATVSFMYSLTDTDWEWYNSVETESSNQVYFRIQVKDANKRIVYDRYYNMFEDFLEYSYDVKKNVMTFTTTLGGLTRKSSYTVSVTACYLDEKSKEMSKGFKTTDVPAAYPYEQGGSFDYPFSKDKNSDYMTADGGIDISVGGRGDLSSYPALTSNNTYTLIAYPDNWEAKQRLSDTLTWKSSNTKVASVKANAGTYTATLKTVRKGTTKIEVSSKLTKRIIARWTVIVNAVGDADYYFGDLDDTEYGTDGMEAEFGELQVLTVDNPVVATLAPGEGVLAVFDAPAYGRYSFNGYDGMFLSYNDAKERESVLTSRESKELRQSETRYFTIKNLDDKTKTVKLTATADEIYQTMGMSGITLKENATVVFTAPETNYYSVYRNGDDSPVWEGKVEQGEQKKITLSKGTYTVSKRTVISGLATGEHKDITIPAKTTNWYAFTAPEDMEYTFAKTSDDVIIRFYEDIAESNFKSNLTQKLEKGKTVYIALANNTDAEVKTDLTITAAAELVSTAGASTPTTFTLPETETAEGTKVYERWARLKFDEAGRYHIKVTGKVGDAEQALTVQRASSTTENGYGNYSSYEGDFDKDQIIYLKIKSTVAETNVTITVSKLTGSVPESIGEESKEVNLNADSYAFTAKTAGEYVFSAEQITVEGQEPIDVYVKVYDENGNVLLDTGSLGRAASSGSLTLGLGQKVYVRYYTKKTVTAAKAAGKIEKLSPTVFADKWEGTIKVGETKWLQFKPSEDAYYTFTTETKQTSENGNGSVSGAIPSDKNYKLGEVINVRLTAIGADVTYTITASPVKPEAIPSGEFELAAGAAKWFKFTAAQDGSYKAVFTGTNISVDRYDSSFNNIGFTNEMSMDAGETYYFKVENRDTATQKATLSVTQITADPMTLESKTKDAELANGEYVWYSFQASKPGYYSITASAAENGSASVNYYDKIGGNTKDYNSNLNVVYLAAKETLYVKVTGYVSEGKTKVTTTLTAIEPTDITPGEAAVEKKDEKVAANGINWYSISGEGVYTVTLSDVTSGQNYFYYMKNGEVSYSTTSAIQLTLGTEDTYTFAVRGSIEGTYTLKAEKRDVKQVSLAQSVSASLKQGEELYVSFTVPENGRYAVMLDGLKDNVTANLNVIDGVNSWNVDGSYSYKTFYSTINNKVTFKVSGVTSETSVDLTVSAKAITKDTVTDLTESKKATIDVNSIPVGHMSWYAFTAPEDGVYTAKVSDADVQLKYCYSLDGSYSLENGTNQAYTFNTYKGSRTKYFAVYYNTKPSANVEFSISKLEAHELAIGGEGIKVDTANVVPGERYRFIFIAPEDGLYTFPCVEEVDPEAGVASPLVSKYRTYSENEYNSNNMGAMVSLKKDEKLIFDAVYANKALKNYTISAAKQEIQPVAAEGLEFTLKAGEYLFASITSETSKNLTVSVEAPDGITYTRAYNTLSDFQNSGNFNYLGTQSLKAVVSAGNAAYIGFRADKEGTVKVSYTEGEEIAMLTVGSNNPISFAVGETEKTVTFTAQIDDVYTIRESNNNVDIDIQLNGVSYGRQVYIRHGDTALVKISNYSNITDFNIVVERKNLTSAEMDETKRLNFSSGYAYVQFEAPSQGMYSFAIDNTGWMDVYRLQNQSSGWENVAYASLNPGKGIVVLDKGSYIAEIGTETSYINCTISYEGKAVLLEDSETPYDFTVNNGEAVYVKYYTEGTDNRQFDIKADASVRVEYLPSVGSEGVLLEEGTEISAKVRTRDNSCLKITGTRNNTQGSLSFRWLDDDEAQLLSKGYNEIYKSNEAEWVDYTYRCEESGEYGFRFLEDKGITKIEVYNAAELDTPIKTIDFVQNATETCPMDFGKEYMVRFYNMTDGWFELFFAPTKVIEDINSTPYVHSVNYNAGIIHIAYTAPESGNYYFSAVGNGEYSLYTCLYDTEGNVIMRNGDSSYVEHEMNEGETVFFETYSNSSYTIRIRKYENGQSNLTVTVSESDLPFESSVIYGSNTFVFTAQEDGEYTFYSEYAYGDIDTKATLYDYETGEQLEYSDDDGEGSNFLIQYTLKKGQTVQLVTKPYSNEDTGCYLVHIEK